MAALDADRDQPEHLSVVGPHGPDRPLGRAQAPGIRLEHHPTGERGIDVADERLADQARRGVGVAGPVGVHHDDEVGAGVSAHLFGVRLQDGGRVHHRRGQCGPHQRGRCDAAGDGEHDVPGGVLAALAVLQVRGRTSGQHHDRDDDHL